MRSCGLGGRSGSCRYPCLVRQRPGSFGRRRNWHRDCVRGGIFSGGGGGGDCAVPARLFTSREFSISRLSVSFGLMAARAKWAEPSTLTSALIHGRSRDVLAGLHSELSSSRRSIVRAYGSPPDLNRSSSDRRTSNVAVKWPGSPATYPAGRKTATRNTLDGLE